MCCFSAPTEVHGTKIFARLVAPGRQVLAYQMRYEAKTPTAMILPLPVAVPARESSIRFKNLKDYSGFFDRLDAAFPEPEHFTLTRSKSVAAAAAPPPLAVQEVGDFIASVVPTQADFDRLDPRFAIKRDVWSRIPEYRDYAFAVFQLKELSGSPHPMAFEFDSRLRDTAFFPTVHIHDGTVHDKGDFDHVLYLQEGSLDARAGDYDGPHAVDKRTGFVRSSDKASSFVDAAQAEGLVDGSLLLHKTTLRGLLPNKDTVYDLRAIASHAGACGRCDVGPAPAATDLAWSPASAALAGLAWIIRRRDALRRRG